MKYFLRPFMRVGRQAAAKTYKVCRAAWPGCRPYRFGATCQNGSIQNSFKIIPESLKKRIPGKAQGPAMLVLFLEKQEKKVGKLCSKEGGKCCNSHAIKYISNYNE